MPAEMLSQAQLAVEQTVSDEPSVSVETPSKPRFTLPADEELL